MNLNPCKAWYAGNFFTWVSHSYDNCFYLYSIDGNLIKMTEDHRVSSYSERLRIGEIGEALKDGETRLCGN